MQLKLTTVAALLAAVTPALTSIVNTSAYKLIEKTAAVAKEITALTGAEMADDAKKAIENYAALGQAKSEVIRNMQNVHAHNKFLEGTTGILASGDAGEDETKGGTASDSPTFAQVEKFIEESKGLLLSLESQCPSFKALKISEQPLTVLRSDEKVTKEFAKLYYEYNEDQDDMKPKMNELLAMYTTTEKCFSG